MPTPAKPRPRARPAKTASLRQSVTIPGPLAQEVRRLARERHLTMSRTLVSLAERGVRAEEDVKVHLKSAYREFLREQEPAKKEAAGKEMIRAIFGTEAIAEDSLL